MGLSASSLLDESKSNFIRDQTEAELKAFSPYYSKQYSVAHLAKVENELEQHKEKMTQLLLQREAPEDGAVLYEEGIFFFDDNRKWKERYVVVRANYCLECHDSSEGFIQGIPPRYKLIPTEGTVLTTEEGYMDMVNRCFPDDANSVKEDFAPPLAGLPGHFPVYLRLPYQSDFYFCFQEEGKRDNFLSILAECIRHQNQDFMKKKTCDVQAFLKAFQLYRQEKTKLEARDMLIGSDVRAMANLVMEQLLPILQKDMLPCLKAKKKDKKKVWFAVLEAAYIMIQEYLLEGLTALKNECSTSARQQEVLIHSDMDQIVSSRRLVENKLKASVSEPAESFCAQSVQPFLASVLDELMEPVSSGFQEGRQLIDSTMDQLCRDFQTGMGADELERSLAILWRPKLQSCYKKIATLQDRLQHLQEHFGFSGTTGLIHSAQIDLQQLMENAAFTFEQLLYKAIQDNTENASSAIVKVKHRVLKQYDYDSSTVRKRIFHEALVAITFPYIRKNLASTCKPTLQGLEQLVDADHSNFVHVENVYEGILLQILEKDVTRVVKEAAILKKHNLLTDSKDLLTESSRSSGSSCLSSPGSPSRALSSGGEGTEEVLLFGTAEAGVTETAAGSPAYASNTRQPVSSGDDSTVHTVAPEEGRPPPPETGAVAGAAIAEERHSAPTNPGEAAVRDESVDPGPGPTLAIAPQHTPLAALAEGLVSEAVSSAEVEDEPALAAPSSGEVLAVASAEDLDVQAELGSDDLSVSVPSSLNVSPESASPCSYLDSVEVCESDVSTTTDLEGDVINTSESPLTYDPSAGELELALGGDASFSQDVPAAGFARVTLQASEGAAARPTSPTPPPLDSVRAIRDLVVEVTEVEELVQHYPTENVQNGDEPHFI